MITHIMDLDETVLLRRAVMEIKRIKPLIDVQHQGRLLQICDHISTFEREYLEARRFQKLAKILGKAITELRSATNDPSVIIDELHYCIFRHQSRPFIQALVVAQANFQIDHEGKKERKTQTKRKSRSKRVPFEPDRRVNLPDGGVLRRRNAI